MDKLDAKFTGDIFKVKNGEPVPPDEYVVFLAKDDCFALALEDYVRYCYSLGCDYEQLAAVNRMAGRVRAWRIKNADKCKKPDAKGDRLLDLPDAVTQGEADDIPLNTIEPEEGWQPFTPAHAGEPQSVTDDVFERMHTMKDVLAKATTETGMPDPVAFCIHEGGKVFPWVEFTTRTRPAIVFFSNGMVLDFVLGRWRTQSWPEEGRVTVSLSGREVDPKEVLATKEAFGVKWSAFNGDADELVRHPIILLTSGDIWDGRYGWISPAYDGSL